MIIAVRFPSPIQPWLLNQIGQVYRFGGSAVIIAKGPEGETHPPLVDRLGLLDATHYLTVDSPARVLGGLGRLILPGSDGALARKGVRRIVQAGWRPRGLRALAKAIARAPAATFDDVQVIHAHSLRFAYEYLFVSEVLDVPMALTFHGHTTAGVGTLAPAKRGRLFEAISFALVNTRFAKNQLADLGCPVEKIRILPQGIRLEDYPFTPQPFPGSGPVRLLSVSRLQRDKGLHYAVEAVDELLRRGHDVDYTIVGGGPEAASLQAQVEHLGRQAEIRLAGRVSDERLRELYRDSHILVLPSLSNPSSDHTETQGVVVQEAQASGVIVTASRVGGIPECVDDGESAFLFPDRDSEAIAAIIGQLLDRPDDWPIWQRRAREWVERRFDIDALGEELMRLYAMARANYHEGDAAPRERGDAR